MTLKLNEMLEKPLGEVLKEMDLADTKIHSDDSGEIKCIELKYIDLEENNIAVIG